MCICIYTYSLEKLNTLRYLKFTVICPKYGATLVDFIGSHLANIITVRPSISFFLHTHSIHLSIQYPQIYGYFLLVQPFQAKLQA